MKLHRVIVPTESQVTATTGRATLRAFATFCDRNDPAVFAAAGVTVETLAHIAKIEKWLASYMNAVTIKERS